MIRKLFSWLIFAFRTPSAFYDDWRAYLVNVLGHAGCVGLAPGLLAAIAAPAIMAPLNLPAWPVIASAAALTFLLYGLWEGAQFVYMRAYASDCIEDQAFVMLGHAIGAAFGLGFIGTGLALLCIFALFAGSGAVFRAEHDTFTF